MIDFLTSAGVIVASKTIADQDIQIGIPSMLLCIEMAAFAIMHLFAFPWREYDLSKAAYMDPVTAPGSGYSGAKPEYKGGAFGLKAWMDAFNPWDIIKASARGFRWLFVGRKHRHHDISYRTDSMVGDSPLDAPQTSIPGPNVTTSTAPSATELQQGRGRADTAGHYDDRTGLLSDGQSHRLSVHSLSPSPSRPGSYEARNDEVDVTMASGGRMPYSPDNAFVNVHAPPPHAIPMPMPAGYNADTEYHAAPSAPSNFVPQDQGNVHENGQWNHWAGATRGQ